MNKSEVLKIAAIRKRFACILIALCLCAALLTGCSKETVPAEDDVSSYESNFAPETTAAGGLTAALGHTADPIDQMSADNAPVADDIPTVEDVSADVPDAQNPEQALPAATAAPISSSVSTIDGYGEVTNDELGISFGYPVNWLNQPGRSSICYLQKAVDGSYPARVCITMKRLAHSCNESKAQAQLVSYLKKLREQYDASTFEVDLNLDTQTLFMGRKAMSTTYLAYDGDIEIKGYVILTYFDKYVYCFHFLCGYDDYPDYESAIRYMRDSAKCTLSLDDD